MLHATSDKNVITEKNKEITYKMGDEVQFNDQTLIEFVTGTQIQFADDSVIIIENNTVYDNNNYGKSIKENGEIIEFNGKRTVLALGKGSIINFLNNCKIKFLQNTATNPLIEGGSVESYQKNQEVTFSKDQKLALQQMS